MKTKDLKNWNDFRQKKNWNNEKKDQIRFFFYAHFSKEYTYEKTIPFQDIHKALLFVDMENIEYEK